MLLALILLKHPTISYGAQIQETYLRTYPQWAYPVITSIRRCKQQGEWTDYQETICSVDPSGRGADETAACYISQKNGFLYVHEMRAYRDGYSDQTLLDILKGCKKYNVNTLVIESNFGDGIVAELFKKHLQQTKQRILVEEVRANVQKRRSDY